MPRSLRFHAVLLALLIHVGGCGKKADPPVKPREITTKTGIKMMVLPTGEFTMGHDNGEDDETPAHRVKVDPFCIDKYEVTQKAYRRLMGTIPPTKRPRDDGPVQQVTWLQAVRYCNARSLAEGLSPCYDPATLKCDFGAGGYRLPTEAEWEYACRAGTTDDYFFGSDPRDLRKHAWFKGNARKAAHPVGRMQPNAWGLCDMQGNVSEWCNDHYNEDYYQKQKHQKGVSENPRGPASAKYRVLRGGNWDSSEATCRSAARYFEAPGFADVCFRRDAIGFRCVRRAP